MPLISACWRKLDTEEDVDHPDCGVARSDCTEPDSNAGVTIKFIHVRIENHPVLLLQTALRLGRHQALYA